MLSAARSDDSWSAERRWPGDSRPATAQIALPITIAIPTAAGTSIAVLIPLRADFATTKPMNTATVIEFTCKVAVDRSCAARKRSR